jgi:hypothetical protein
MTVAPEWEYRTCSWERGFTKADGNLVRGQAALEPMLSELGEDGWELVQIFDTDWGQTAIFKRLSSGGRGPSTK